MRSVFFLIFISGFLCFCKSSNSYKSSTLYYLEENGLICIEISNIASQEEYDNLKKDAFKEGFKEGYCQNSDLKCKNIDMKKISPSSKINGNPKFTLYQYKDNPNTPDDELQKQFFEIVCSGWNGQI
tara:strand:+ start:25 stop:405 length:381 start_codon:yes stop_codon:yes gene_type:complete